MSWLRILVALAVLGAAPVARAESLTATGSGMTAKDACEAAKANAQKSLPQGKSITKMGQCKCTPSHSTRNCTVSAAY